MSPEQKATRLIGIADEIDSARNLVEAASMATASLSREQSSPLTELLDLISDRLRQISEDLHPQDAEKAA